MVGEFVCSLGAAFFSFTIARNAKWTLARPVTDPDPQERFFQTYFRRFWGTLRIIWSVSWGLTAVLVWFTWLALWIPVIVNPLSLLVSGAISRGFGHLRSDRMADWTN